MATFTDDEKRPWTVRITVADLKTLRELNAHPDDLLAGEMRALAELVGDAERLVGVLYALCHDQAKGAGVEPEAFAAGFGGTGLDAGADALVKAIADFSRGQRRAALTELAAKWAEVKARMGELAAVKIRAIDPDLMAREALLRASTSSATGSPASPALTPPG